ncbi:MAG: FAD binding domain-containing protein [Candidatus Marinimicrobia bacterium]|nr:FAD binding domain-containing protein [Candidatus Neomarinimicrobiota bacterium]
MVDGFRPALLQEALKIRSEYDCTPIAGGTDLMVQKARGFALKPDFEKPLLFIGHLPELHKIIIENNQIHIGAGALLTDLLNSKKIPAIFKEAIGLMASPPSRNLASIGGNICNASPAGDTLPYLYAVNATLVVMSAKGERTNPINEFITGPKQTALRRDELLTKIIIPNKIFDVNFYRKVGQRKGMSLTKAAFLGMADIENGKLTDIRITFGSVAPVIVRSWEIEKYIIGTPLREIKAAITEIQNQFEPLLRPIHDARSTAVYRKKVSLRLLEDFLKNISKEK